MARKLGRKWANLAPFTGKVRFGILKLKAEAYNFKKKGGILLGLDANQLNDVAEAEQLIVGVFKFEFCRGRGRERERFKVSLALTANGQVSSPFEATSLAKQKERHAVFTFRRLRWVRSPAPEHCRRHDTCRRSMSACTICSALCHVFTTYVCKTHE